MTTRFSEVHRVQKTKQTNEKMEISTRNHYTMTQPAE